MIVSTHTKGMKTGFLILLTLFTLAASGQEVNLVDFKPSECDQNGESDRIISRIVSETNHNDTLQIEIGTVATCCVDFTPSIEFRKDTLRLSYVETGEFCECYCCYQFTYFITGLVDEKFVTTLQDEVIEMSKEKYKTYPIEYFIFKGDTTGYLDKYGHRQGVYISEREDNLIKTHWKDGENVKAVLTDLEGNVLKEFKNIPELWDYEIKKE
jgi:hypothetical protein